MRIQLLSDLHLERYPQFRPSAAPGADVLVLAGDIGSYQPRSLLETEDFGLARFSPRQQDPPWKTVLYVPGNHEFDGLDYAQTYRRLRELCDALDISWLDGEAITVGDVRFVGSTLWSDFDALAREEKTSEGRAREREKAFRAANFYLNKNTTLIDGKPALAEQLRELALSSQAWLREALARPFAGTTVAVTHYAPSLKSADPRYGRTPGTAGFCNALDELLPLAHIWMHGHLHCPNDYTVDGHREGRTTRTRVVANPRGYASKGEQAEFRDFFTLDLPIPDTSP